MAMQADVKFEKGIPAVDLIFSSIRDVTGLEIGYKENGEKIYIDSEGMRRVELFLDYDRNIVEVLSFMMFNHYLYCTVTYSLTKIGGISTMSFPKWSSKRWEEIKWWEVVFR